MPKFGGHRFLPRRVCEPPRVTPHPIQCQSAQSAQRHLKARIHPQHSSRQWCYHAYNISEPPRPTYHTRHGQRESLFFAIVFTHSGFGRFSPGECQDTGHSDFFGRDIHHLPLAAFTAEVQSRMEERTKSAVDVYRRSLPGRERGEVLEVSANSLDIWTSADDGRFDPPAATGE